MTIKQISVFLENKPGKLAEFTKCLSQAGINLRALSVAEASDFGIIRVLVDDIYNATTVLRDADYICSITEVLAVEVKDQPGALAEMISVLADSGVNVEYMYAVTSSKKASAYMIVRVSDNKAAVEVLEKAGIKTVAQDKLV
ncbi:MAG: ACT domain-containing protein [Blautia sp.]|nr:ACT domain-containing protein [Blautia sp.]